MRRHLLAFYKVAKKRDIAPLKFSCECPLSSTEDPLLLVSAESPLSMRRVTGSLSEVEILSTDQKERGLWEREWFMHSYLITSE